MIRQLILACLIVASVYSITPGKFHWLRPYLNKAQFGEDAAVAVSTGQYRQFVDHFALNNTSPTFSQRYVWTTQFRNNNKVAFLFVSNEAGLEAAVLSDDRNPIVRAAARFGAIAFGLEHRYYGSSKPFDTFDAFNLRFLNSFQAIQDVITFCQWATVEYKMDPDVRWILWGSGYGGIIAAEARKWNPSVISGVIASSAPLKHKYDFWEFNDQVEQSIAQVGGENCRAAVTAGFAQINKAMLTPTGRASISDTFLLNPRLDNTSLTYNDIQQFYETIINPFQVIVQFDNEFGLNIDDMCTVVQNKANTPMQNIYNVYVYLVQAASGSNTTAIPPLVTGYADVIADLSNPYINNTNIEQRMWMYQVCTEFGYFYTTNKNENSMFGTNLPTSLSLNQCFDIFPDAKLTATQIRDLVDNYNNYYGAADNYAGTNAVFTNGAYDPWARLGKESSGDYSVVTYYIPLASMSADMFPGNRNNTFIDQAHRLMFENIGIWINSPKSLRVLNTTFPWTRPDPWALFQLPQQKKEESRFGPAMDISKMQKEHVKSPLRKKIIFGRPPHGLLPQPDIDESATLPPGYSEGTFRQRVDHFDNTNPDFFSQRYFKNEQWAQAGGPNFLMIGGEGPESGRWVLNQDITYLTWAKKYGATVYLLEHRFYGYSTVGKDNSDLSKLNSLQMLYDLADFIKAVNNEKNSTAPWITFGGSYSGAMSAWMREVFPDLVIGAVGSSGPVFAKTDFYEYLMVVENSIRTYSADCASRIKSGFDTMQQLWQTAEGRANLSNIFQLQPAFNETTLSDLDKHYFFSNIYGNYQGAVQYSGDNTGPYATGYGIPDCCKIMLNDTNTPLQNVVNFNAYMSNFYSGQSVYTGLDNNYQDAVDYLRNAQTYGVNDAASLLWTWQTCTEFGYFQSADSGNGIFGSYCPVNMFVQMCNDIFDEYYDRPSIDRAVDYTNYKYGSRFFYRGTNVVLPNGNVDPWHALGLYDTTDNSVVPYLINGTAHCADMYPARAEDVPGLAIVRNLIDQNIAVWLGQSSVGTTTTTTVIPGSVSTVTPGTGPTANPTGTGSTSTVQTTTMSTSSNSIFASLLVVLSFFFF